MRSLSGRFETLCIAMFTALLTGCSGHGVKIISLPDGVEYAPCPDNMVLVAAAEYVSDPMIGSESNDASKPNPIPVKLPAFCIDRFPALETGMAKNASPDRAAPGSKLRVTYLDAVKACRDRGPGFQVCSEFYWERACRGDHFSTYPYGDNYDAGACPDAVNAPIGETSRCVSDLGVIGMTAGAGEWTMGGDWVLEDLERTHRDRAVVRGLGNGASRACASRAEVYAHLTAPEKKSGKLPVLDTDLNDASRFENGAVSMDDGIVISTTPPPNVDRQNSVGADNARTPFSPIRAQTRFVSTRQGYRCCRLAEIRASQSTP